MHQFLCIITLLGTLFVDVSSQEAARAISIQTLPLDYDSHISYAAPAVHSISWYQVPLHSPTDFAVLRLHVDKSQYSLTVHVPGYPHVLHSREPSPVISPPQDSPERPANRIVTSQSVVVTPSITKLCFFASSPCNISLRIERSPHCTRERDMRISGWVGKMIALGDAISAELSRGQRRNYAIMAPPESKPVLVQMWPDQSQIMAVWTHLLCTIS